MSAAVPVVRSLPSSARSASSEARRIGGLPVSPLALGTSPFAQHCDSRTAGDVVAAALDHGITVFDTADSYGAGRRGAAEEALGQALGRRRAEVVLCSKVGAQFDGRPASAHPARIREALLGTLRRLRTEWLDIYLVHVPDPDVPLEDTLGAMAELRDEGLLRVAGCSNHQVADLARAHDVRPGVLSCVQDELNLVTRRAEPEVLPWCREQSIGFMAYAPLAQGLLTGKYEREVPPGSRLDRIGPDRSLRVVDAGADRAHAIVAACRAEGVDPTIAALAWALAVPGVSSVVVGATSPAQVAHNAAAVHALVDVGAMLERASGGGR